MFVETKTDNRNHTQTCMTQNSPQYCIQHESSHILRLNMKSLVKLVPFLMLMVVPLSKSKESSIEAYEFLKGDTQCSNDSACPTWFICDSKKRCHCGDGHKDKILCDDRDHTSAVLNCNCVTYDKDKKSTYVGRCFYNCQSLTMNSKRDLVIRQLPKDPETLINNSACTYFHRTGLLCGDCEEGYSPLVLSYNLSCVECPDGHKNWWKFIVIGFVPLTVFYLFILAFNINVTSSRLHGVVWYSQAISMPSFTRIMLLALSIEDVQYLTTAQIFEVFYTYWNLDLFRPVIPQFCLNVTTLQALALEYLLALYPFVLTLLSYFLIVLYDRKVTFIVTAWKPFRKVLEKFRTSWDIRTSIIDSFATFFLLSHVKILSITSDLLLPTEIYQLGSNKPSYGVYYSPSVPYFGKYHLPYAILAISIFTLFVVIPSIILILYPFRFFQKTLSLFPINWHFLHAFVDSFQGSYKNGTEPGTFDCRSFSSVILLIRPMMYILYGFTLSMMYFVYGLIALLILLIAMINIQPLKMVNLKYPLADLMFAFLLTFTHIAVLGRGVANIEKYFYLHTALTLTALLSAFIPLLYISYLIGSWLLSKINLHVPCL